MVYRLQNGVFVDRHVECLAHFQFRQRAFFYVVAEVANVKARLIQYGDFAGFFRCVDFSGFRIGGDVTFACLDFLCAHRGVFGDGKHQVVDFHVVLVPVVWVFHEANLCVFLVVFEGERPCADREYVQIAGFARFFELRGVFRRVHHGERHGDVLNEGCVYVFQHHFNGVVVHFGDGGNIIRQCHV